VDVVGREAGNPRLAQVVETARRVNRDAGNALAILGDDGEEIRPMAEGQGEDVVGSAATRLIGDDGDCRRAASSVWISNEVLEVVAGDADRDVIHRAVGCFDPRLTVAGSGEGID